MITERRFLDQFVIVRFLVAETDELTLQFLQKKLGKWRYKSKSQGTFHDGYMFPLLVKEQLESWPEKNVRQRRWVCIYMFFQLTFQIVHTL